MRITRRDAIGVLAAAVPASANINSSAPRVEQQEGGIAVDWLGGNPPQVESGVSWGVPWPRGTVQKSDTFQLTTAEGNNLPLQSWTLAYWPNGSIKLIGRRFIGPPGNTIYADQLAGKRIPGLACHLRETASNRQR